MFAVLKIELQFESWLGLFFFSVGYTMSDIRYKWAKGAGSVGVSNDVSLPQFKVMGYRQKAFEISLSTGNYSRLACEIQVGNLIVVGLF
jgi:hypothetical protein